MKAVSFARYKEYTRKDWGNLACILSLFVVSTVGGVCGIVTKTDKLVYFGLFGLMLAIIIAVIVRIDKLEKQVKNKIQ